MSCTGLSCNQGRAPCRDGCHGGSPTRQRTCDELGVCQGRHPSCHDDCHQVPGAHVDTATVPPGEVWFVHGAVDDTPAPEPLSWLEVALIAMAASGAVGLVAGLAWGWWRGLL